MNFLSGLLLTGVVVAIVYFIVKEVFWERIAASFARQSNKPAEPAGDYLLGSIGKVVESTADGALNVRIGMERWRARLTSNDDRDLPVGSAVKITAINGLVLDVEEHSEIEEEASAAH